MSQLEHIVRSSEPTVGSLHEDPLTKTLPKFRDGARWACAAAPGANERQTFIDNIYERSRATHGDLFRLPETHQSDCVYVKMVHNYSRLS